MWLMFLLPYASLFFLDKSALRRYISVAFFVTILNVIVYQIAWQLNWWRYKETLFAWDRQIPAHIIFGVYWIATIWIFYLTFHRYWLYLLVNAALDGLFAFVAGPLLTSLGVRTGNLSPFFIFLIMLAFANIIYGYQRWYEAEVRTSGRHNKLIYASERLRHMRRSGAR